MEEEEFLNNDDQQKQIRYSIERYEEMIRNKDAYFFDVDAFVNIVDYYIERNDPVKALQVIEYAKDQHPDSVEFLLREAQLLAMVELSLIHIFCDRTKNVKWSSNCQKRKSLGCFWNDAGCCRNYFFT